MRIRSVAAAVVAAVVAAVAAGSPAAAVETPVGGCYATPPLSTPDPAGWSAPGNVHTAWAAPFGLESDDALRVTAYGSVRIDYWGTNKSIAGEPPAAGAGWPAPDAPRYALIAKVTQGSMWVRATRRSYGPHQWFPIGADSGCMLYSSAGPGAQLVFSFNDPNLGDNGGGATVSVRQWWGLL